MSLRYIRRCLIWVIALVAVAVLINYIITMYRRSRDETKDLTILHSETVQSAQSIEYSDNREGKLRFRIIAQQLVETRQGKNFLQGIRALDFNADGSVRNEIQSSNALYDRENRTVDFTGNVRVFVGADVELQTDSLHYDLNSNIGQTDNPVRFYSESVTGKALGLTYNLNTRLLELKRSVEFMVEMQQQPSEGSGTIDEFSAVSDRALTYDDLKEIELLGHARLESATFRLTGEAIRTEMDTGVRKLKSLVASGRAQYRSKVAGDSRVISGDRIAFELNTESRNPENVFVSGNADLELRSPGETRRLRASEIDVHLDHESGALSGVDARSGVLLDMIRGRERTSVSGELFDAVFSRGTQEIEQINVRRQARISTTGRDASNGNEISAEWINVKFGHNSGNSILEELRAEESAHLTFLDIDSADEKAQTTSVAISASVIEMRYSREDGALHRVDVYKDVVISELNSGGEADGPLSTLMADMAIFHFYPGNNKLKEMTAKGNVQFVQKADSISGQDAAEGAFRTWSDEMKALFSSDSGEVHLVTVSQWGHFRYEDASSSANSGRCDYDASLEKITLRDSPEIFFDMGSTTGDLVEFDRLQGVLQVHGKVRSVLSGNNTNGFAGNLSGNAKSIVLSDSMEYRTNEGSIRYTKNVYLLSEDQQLQADILEISDNGEHILAEGNIVHRILKNPIVESRGRSDKELPVFHSKEKEQIGGRPIRIESNKLEYVKAANTVTYSGNVTLDSEDLRLESGILEAVLNEEGNMIEKATATKDVVVFKENWKCQGEVAYYFSDPERYVVLGSPLEFFDPTGVRSFPHRLTYIVADDRIQMEGRSN